VDVGGGADGAVGDATGGLFLAQPMMISTVKQKIIKDQMIIFFFMVFTSQN
jgi:hypothetical protein